MMAGCGAASQTLHRSGGARPGFVAVADGQLQVDGAPYRYCGANMWYAAYLGADAAFGNRDRLRRELDQLSGVGVDNLRILASGEDSPLKNSLKPAFRGPGPDYNEALLGGLDFALAEMGQRNMRAVLYLTNFWEWSGGMMTYLQWTNGGEYIDMNDPAHPWPEFPDFTSRFYAQPEAVALYHDYVRAMVGRTNTITGGLYSDDKTIQSWQLANEPRPGGSADVAAERMPDFYAWIQGTAQLIKSLDANHLVSTGNEGLKGCMERAEVVLAAHEFPEIDYLTAHIWPQNWGWVDPADLAGTFAQGEANVREYIEQHLGYAQQLGRPLVFEEFGFPRDEESYEAGTPTTFKDRFYGVIYDAVLESARAGGPAAGSNFWAWSGEGRAQHADYHMQVGDTSYVGDPPHEPQGWYSVFDSDESTLALIRAHAQAIRAA
jgi:mannan endo-1,4-beta-mannosidase